MSAVYFRVGASMSDTDKIREYLCGIQNETRRNELFAALDRLETDLAEAKAHVIHEVTERETLRAKDRVIHGGSYPTTGEAAIARDLLALEHHGEFARTNFPREVVERLAFAEAEADRLRAALAEYGKHRSGCMANYYATPLLSDCDCGLALTLAGTETTPPNEGAT